MGTVFAVPIGRSRIGTRLEDVAEGPEEEAGEHHGDGEGEDPGQPAELRTVDHCKPE